MAAMTRHRTIGMVGAASRRDVLRTLGGAAAAGVVAAITAAGSESKKQHRTAGARNGSPSRKARSSGDTAQEKVSRSGGAAQRAGATTVTKTFTTLDPISIRDFTSATPFPSRLRVDGFAAATLTDVNLILNGFSHTYPADVDVLLAAPDGRNALVMSDAGSGVPVTTALTIELDDQAGSGVPEPLISGAFRPTNLNFGGPDVFSSPSPPLSGNAELSVFQGIDPNGVWQLFIQDDTGGKDGSISGGWQLEITATMPAPATIPPKKKKKKKHKKKKH